MDAHPLISWLNKRGLKLYKFAEDHKFHARTLYAHVNGEVEAPGLDTLGEIEKATGGDIKVQDQWDWFKARAKHGKKK